MLDRRMNLGMQPQAQRHFSTNPGVHCAGTRQVSGGSTQPKMRVASELRLDLVTLGAEVTQKTSPQSVGSGESNS